VARKKKPDYIIDGKKYLEAADLAKFESFQKDSTIQKLEQELIEKESEVLTEKRLKLSTQLEVVNKELEIVMLKKKLLSQEQSVKGNSYRMFIESLKEKYEISGRFGYDPDSGEIKE